MGGQERRARQNGHGKAQRILRGIQIQTGEVRPAPERVIGDVPDEEDRHVRRQAERALLERAPLEKQHVRGDIAEDRDRAPADGQRDRQGHRLPV